MSIMLLNSKGINTKAGAIMIRNKLQELGHKNIGSKKIFVVSFPAYEIDQFIINNLTEIVGVNMKNIYLSSAGIPESIIPDYVYVTEGNTFEILNYMRINGLIDYIRRIYKENEDTVYIGSSAGAMIAGSDILLARDFDSNDVGIMDYTSLRLFEGTVIPHYEPEQLKLYLSFTEDHIKNRYRQILSVGDEEIIMMKGNG